MKAPDYDIIMLALPRWDGPYSSTAYSLAQALSAHTRVFYIDNPFTWKDVVRERKSSQIQRRRKALLKGKDIFVQPDASNPRLIAVTPRLVLPINWLPQGKAYDFFARYNDKIVMEALEETIRAYGVKKYVFINSFNPLFGKFFPSSFSPYLNLYHAVDDISKSAYVAKHGTRLEAEAVKQADFSFVTSTELRRLKSDQTDREVYLIPNAANVELFQQAVTSKEPAPIELKDVGSDRHVICYVGNICHRLDYDLLVKIAKAYPEKVLLMVGPLSNDNYKKAGLDKHPNVIFAGKKSLAELPMYLKYSHCCIIPFLCNTLTKSIYPLKINEYLSAGKPVVTTNFSEDIANFGEVACVSATHEEFIANIATAIHNDRDEKVKERVQYAAANNWAARAEQLLDIITHVNARKND